MEVCVVNLKNANKHECGTINAFISRLIHHIRAVAIIY